MMLQNAISQLVESNSGKNPLYVRNVIKEELQNYILNYIFTANKYSQLVFTGGTCLRKVYGLNRLSEDLDLDYVTDFGIEEFAKNTVRYFKSVLQYRDISYSISGNRNTVYLKFPLLKELKFYSKGTPEDIFVRCDFSKEERGGINIDQNMITAGAYQFFVTSYDLPTLFANKIVAFLARTFYKGAIQKIPFKGRDLYDVFWMTQLSSKSAYQMTASKERLQALLPGQSLIQIKEQFCEKIALIDTKFLYDDLLPLLDSKDVLEGFIKSYKEYLLKYIHMVIR